MFIKSISYSPDVMFPPAVLMRSQVTVLGRKWTLELLSQYAVGAMNCAAKFLSKTLLRKRKGRVWHDGHVVLDEGVTHSW